jgi:hypothetical protein
MKLTRRRVLVGGAATAAASALPLPVAQEIYRGGITINATFEALGDVPRCIYRVRGGNRVHVTRSPEYLNRIARRIVAEKEARAAILRALRHRSLAPLPDAV